MSNIENSNRPIIFYGAGEEAKKKLAKWEKDGLVPVCFTDADASKHGIKFTVQGLNREYDILSLSKAIERYPDYLLYLTLGHEKLRSVTDFLIEHGVPKERIKCADALEWRKGCPCLGQMIGFSSSISTCISWAFAKRIERGNDFETDIFNYHKYCDQMLNDWRKGIATHCEGCNLLHEGYWEVKPEIEMIDIGGMNYCNFNCIYCNVQRHGTEELYKKRHSDIMGLLRHVRDVSSGSAKISVSFATGEPSINPNIDELLSFWRESKMKVNIVSNASVYKDSIASFLSDCDSVLHTSLDAGTRETFAEIKSIDCFDEVVSNLRRYAGNGAKIQLKYIILPEINDNATDIRSFLEIANSLNAEVFLSSDHHKSSSPLPHKTLQMCLLFIREYQSRGLKSPSIVSEYFHSSDIQRIERFTVEMEGYRT